MKLRNSSRRVALAAALFLGGAGGVSALEIFNTNEGATLIQNASMRVDGRLQFFGHGEIVKDPVRDDTRVYLYLKHSRLRIHGNLDKVNYEMQLAFGGEDENRSGLNAGLNLLDFYFDVPLTDALTLKVGQFLVPYSRERLNNSGQQLFAERSIGNLAWRVGYDVGGAVIAKKNNWIGTVGVFTGGGRDVPERYLPEKLGLPLVAVRAGYNDGIDEDIYDSNGEIGTADRVKQAVFVNAIYTQDTAIGHNVVLNLKTTEKPLLLDSNWNPYLAKTPQDRGTLTQMGGDYVVKFPVGGATVLAQAEGNYAAFENVYGRIDLSGGTGVLGVAKSKWEIAARYTYLTLSPKMRSTGTTASPTPKVIVTSRKPVQEITPSITYHITKGRSKLIFDMPILTGVPVVYENGLGAYVLTSQPGQTNTANAIRRTVVQGRMIYQLSF